MTTHEQATAAIRTLLDFIGEDPDREGLRDTPTRAAKAWQEWTRGYAMDPAKILERTFGDVGDYDEMIIVRDIRVESTCEHHLAPIIGRAWIGYVPRQNEAGQVSVVGLSKIPRAVEALAKRLQVQERLTSQIATAIETALEPLGVAVVIRASHHCMCTRGVHQIGAEMVTSAMRGVFRNDPAARSEFVMLAGAALP
jgi:GTP cyclohydrolase I